ncbi:MAG: putative quinol monooxygenase [Chloracidobacterium sp.]|uniref:Antibiotic biosynthesis monooxygenase n=1 Tax=Chloracidobacterium validum TaxID=2821543 RepID=A0ABX8B8V9_9BACT|nr:putative quinol monooxygenase [Chloracidobacterium validum]QUW02114.1 antibiotic biosynthesis monooxygenase [Chloracidobacterium validum]
MPHGPVAIMVHLKARPGFENNILGAVAALIDPIRQHPHCQYYDFHIHADDPTRFTSYEVWSSLEAFRAHLASPFIQAMQDAAQEFLERPLEYDVLQSIQPVKANETTPIRPTP